MDDDSLAQGPSFVQRTLSSLRWRNFRLFFIGQTISQTGNWLTNIALTLLILHRTGSGVALGPKRSWTSPPGALLLHPPSLT